MIELFLISIRSHYIFRSARNSLSDLLVPGGASNHLSFAAQMHHTGSSSHPACFFFWDMNKGDSLRGNELRKIQNYDTDSSKLHELRAQATAQR